jgi:hypothetical protein
MKLKEIIPVHSHCEHPAHEVRGKAMGDWGGTGIPLNTAIGDRDLCVWQPVRGICWVQTRNPKHARRLAKRSDGRLVAYGVTGGFLKTFEFQKPLAWAVRLLNRYTAAELTANAVLGRAICPETNRKA